MFCDQCGMELAPAAGFCSRCGKAAAAPAGAPASSATGNAPPAYAPVSQAAPMPFGRVNRHRTTLAVLWLVWGGFSLMGLMWLAVLGHSVLPYFGPWVPRLDMGVPLERFVHGLIGLGIVVLSVRAVLSVLTGWALLQRAPWGRTLAIVTAIVSLIKIPFGTALGIYTLWVLTPNPSEEEYRQLARAM